MFNAHPNRLCLAALCIAAGLLCASLRVHAAERVRVIREDVDDDGVAELVLQNEYLSVEVLTGEEPDPPEPGFWDRLLGGEKAQAKPTYGTRFVGPGWIRNVTFRPTGRRWFFNDRRPGGLWHGIPEEFDQAVRMKEIAPGVWHCLKIGVGICRGTGRCSRGTLSLIDPGRWRMTVEDMESGAAALEFVQEIDTDYGYAYTYRKRIEMRPGESRFLTTRTLTNRGLEPMATTWYTHGFWGQSDLGDSYDDTCWVTIPIQSLQASGSGPVNTDPCVVSNRHPAHYWGAIDGQAVGGNWYACGQALSREIFINAFSRKPDFYRVWSYTNTYSCEPFQVIDLAAGQSVTWEDLRGCAQGLPRVDAQDGLAAYALGSGDADTGTQGQLAILGAPFVDLDGASLAVKLTHDDGSQSQSRHELQRPSPDRPFSLMLDARVEDISRVEINLTGYGAGIQLADMGPAVIRPGSPWPAIWPEVADDALAVIFSELGRDAEGDLIPDLAVSYLTDYLLRAGFTVSLAHPRENWSTVDWRYADLIVFAGLGRLAQKQVSDLEWFVEVGGGLMITGPLNLSSFEFSTLLPAESVTSSIELEMRPSDCTREFLGASEQRYHLRAASDHAIVRGLPLYPDAYQDIARLQLVQPRDDASVVLRYATPEGLVPGVEAPALLTRAYGEGRVVLLTTPPDWGNPATWCIWSRLGEYHRKMLIQAAVWASQ